jgi:shikimate kinase
LARDLEHNFFDIDVEFEREIGMKIKEFVAQHGWPEFRKREEDTLRKVVQENPSRAVIATGGGVVETPVRDV